MSQSRVLIIADVEEAKEAYARAVTEFEVPCDVVFSFKDGLRRATEAKFNGVIIDILTLLRSSQDDKQIANEFIHLFPTLRLSWDKRTRQMTTGLPGHAVSVDPMEELRSFLQGRCTGFPARTMRKHERAAVCLNALLARDGVYREPDAAKTFTVNVSEGGVFLHTVAPYQIGDTVAFTIKEFADTAPITARVCWKIEWGQPTRSIPGIGVEFQHLSERQREEIQHLMKSTLKTPLSRAA